jgi:DNA-binding response OmpR family regulator
VAGQRSKPRVLLVEDEPSISEPVSRVLGREGFDPTVAATAADALRLAQLIEPDLVLLDLMLPDGDGRDVCTQLRRSSDVPIIMLTARASETDRVVGLELGADDYVVKPFSGLELVARMRAVLRRQRSDGVREMTRKFGGLEVDSAARRVHLHGREVDLSRKEFDLLEALIAAPGRVVTREHLMATVWATEWVGPTRTLDVHIGTLRRKLGDDPAQPRYIHTVRGVGFRFAAEDERAH